MGSFPKTKALGRELGRDALHALSHLLRVSARVHPVGSLRVSWWDKSGERIREIDAQLEAAFIRYAVLPEDQKLLASTYAVQLVARLIPGYDFRRGFYVQFVALAVEKPSQVMSQGTSTLIDVRDGAKDVNEPLAIVADVLSLFFALFTLDNPSKSTMSFRGDVLANRSRSLNDLIQNFLATKLFELAGDWVRSEVLYR